MRLVQTFLSVPSQQQTSFKLVSCLPRQRFSALLSLTDQGLCKYTLLKVVCSHDLKKNTEKNTVQSRVILVSLMYAIIVLTLKEVFIIHFNFVCDVFVF